MDDRKMMEELGERLCDFCPLEDWEKGSHLLPNGYSSCEGSRCEDALEHYLEENEMEEDYSNNVRKLNNENDTGSKER